MCVGHRSVSGVFLHIKSTLILFLDLFLLFYIYDVCLLVCVLASGLDFFSFNFGHRGSYCVGKLASKFRDPPASAS